MTIIRLIIIAIPPTIIGGLMPQILPSPTCYFAALGIGLAWGLAFV